MTTNTAILDKSARRSTTAVRKIATGIIGFDTIAEGGLPTGGMTLVSGTAGAAKTVFATQYLAQGILHAGENAVFVTFEEPPEQLCNFMLGLGWDLATWEADGRLAFVDASPYMDGQQTTVGAFNLDALLARISHAVQQTGAKRLVIDSLGTMFHQVRDRDVVRTELFRVAQALKKLGVTSILTAERELEEDGIGRYGVEEFVCDNVIILRNRVEDEKRRRTVEILKFRGTKHQKGEFPFTILDGQGVYIIPMSGMKLKQQSSNVRMTSGNAELDAMTGGGFLKDSIILVSGATGTGKTLTVTQFIGAGAARGERCLLFAFEESRDQLYRNAESWGFDFQAYERAGLLKVICDYPELTTVDEHLVSIKAAIESFRPDRMAVDSLSAIERVSTAKSFREFVIGLTSFVKDKEIMGMCTSTTPTLMGGTSVTEAHISTITDTIIMLRYVEILGEMRRGLMVLKMRGSEHNKEIREFRIDAKGMTIGRPFKNVTGILAGNASLVTPAHELHQLSGLFNDLGRTDEASR